MSTPEEPPSIKALRAVFENPAVQRCIAGIEAVAGYRLSAEDRKPFLIFHGFITSTPPSYITAWRSDPKTERWYHAHVDGILGQVQNAITCVWCHRDNLSRIEELVGRIFEESGARGVLGNTSVGLGNTQRWDAEYQAFVLAVRRCLDYLTRALAAYFKQEFHSFNDLSKDVLKQEPGGVAAAIATARDRHIQKFDYVLSAGPKKSIRDLISHYRYISAGTLSLNGRGFLMVGGGEGMSPLGIGAERGLGAIIRQRAVDLHTCVSDLIESFVAAARTHEQTLGTRNG
jgi:hypothetical protein